MRKKHQLFLIAGVLWFIAGTMVTYIGLKSYLTIEQTWYFPMLTVAVYLAFYQFIFARLVVKHQVRILEHPDPALPWWQFFDKKSYIIMAIMMIGGIGLRVSGLLPLWFIAFFYTGLGFALWSCGVRFLYIAYKYNDR